MKSSEILCWSARCGCGVCNMWTSTMRSGRRRLAVSPATLHLAEAAPAECRSAVSGNIRMKSSEILSTMLVCKMCGWGLQQLDLFPLSRRLELEYIQCILRSASAAMRRIGRQLSIRDLSKVSGSPQLFFECSSVQKVFDSPPKSTTVWTQNTTPKVSLLVPFPQTNCLFPAQNG